MVSSLLSYLLWGMRNGLAISFVYILFLGIPWMHLGIDMSLERYFQRRHSTVGIMENGSVGVKLFKEQV